MAAPSSFPERLRRWFREPAPAPLVCEIAADYVAAVRQHGGRIQSWATRALPAGAVHPAPLGDNVVNGAAVQEALEHVLSTVADGQRRATLLVPDLLARVAVLEFDRLPESAAEAEALIRWRLSKDLPFDARQAVVSFEVQAGRGSAQEALVAVCLRSALRQYEECLQRLGLQPGWVTLSTLGALGGLATSAAPRLLVKRDHGSLSLAALHGGAVRLFRTLPLPALETPGYETPWLDKVFPAAVYFKDHWGEPVGEVVLAAVGRVPASVSAQLESEVGCPVKDFSLEAFDLPPSPTSGAAPDHRLISSLGWVQGEAE